MQLCQVYTAALPVLSGVDLIGLPQSIVDERNLQGGIDDYLAHQYINY